MTVLVGGSHGIGSKLAIALLAAGAAAGAALASPFHAARAMYRGSKGNGRRSSSFSELRTRKVVIDSYPSGTRNHGRVMHLYPIYSTREVERRKRQIERGILQVSA